MNEGIFLGLGTNLGDRWAQLKAAVAALEATGCEIVRCSAVYETPPWGFLEQPPFLNMVVQVAFGGDPMDLLQSAMQVEHDLGRERTRHWGPRAIDIDLLAFGQLQLHAQRLSLPHPLLQERAFVLVPWAEIAPDFQVVGHDASVAQLLVRLPAQEKTGLVNLGPLHKLPEQEL